MWESSILQHSVTRQTVVTVCLCVCVCVCGFRRLSLICRLRLDSHLPKIFSQTLRNLSPPHLCLSLSLSGCQVSNDLFLPFLPLVCLLFTTFALIYFSLLHWVLGHILLSHRDVLPLFYKPLIFFLIRLSSHTVFSLFLPFSV